MSHLQEKYSQLIALTQLYILQEFDLSQRFPSEKEAFDYFKKYALAKRKKQQKTELVKAEPVLPQPAPQPQKQIATPILPKISEKTPPPIAPIAKEPESKKEVQKEKKTTPFVLEPMEQAKPQVLQSMQTTLLEIQPTLTTMQTPLDDQEAKIKRYAWKQKIALPNIAIFSFQEPLIQQTFLKNIARAIEKLGHSCQVLEVQKMESEWEKLLHEGQIRLIIACDYAILNSPELRKYHREVPKKAQQFLGPVPVFLLPDLSTYLREPNLKASLWQALQDFVEGLKNSSLGEASL